jgi:hypothetical protein
VAAPGAGSWHRGDARPAMRQRWAGSPPSNLSVGGGGTAVRAIPSPASWSGSLLVGGAAKGGSRLPFSGGPRG